MSAPRLRDVSVDEQFKGFAPTAWGLRLDELVAADTNLFDGTFSPPIMVLKRAALDNNIAAIASYCRERGVALAPHGKTTLAPQLWERQLAAGAWAISAATPAQVAMCRAAGVSRVFLANELVDPPTIAWVVRELGRDPGFDFLCYVDSDEGVRRLAAELDVAQISRPFDVVLEVGVPGGRTGVRTAADARHVAEAAARVRGLRVVGVSGYEGGIGHEPDDETLAAVRTYLEGILEIASSLASDGLLVDRGGGIILSAGGSVFFDVVADVFSAGLAGRQPSMCLLRAGSYVSHDSGLYERVSRFTRPGNGSRYSLLPALEAWGEVLSTPEPGLALVGAGRRDVPFDQDLPTPVATWRAGRFSDASTCAVVELNDQHAFVRVPDGVDVQVGDWMSFGVSHPCTAFDKWRLLPEVDDAYQIVDFVATYF